MNAVFVGRDNEVRALAGKAFGNRGTDATACAGYDHRLVFEALHSLFLPGCGCTRSSTGVPAQIHVAARTISAKSDAFNEAPPTRAPPTLRNPKIAAALTPLTEPP